MTQIYTKMTHPTLTTKMCNLVQRDRDLQIAVAQEIGRELLTLYHNAYICLLFRQIYKNINYWELLPAVGKIQRLKPIYIMLNILSHYWSIVC